MSFINLFNGYILTQEKDEAARNRPLQVITPHPHLFSSIVKHIKLRAGRMILRNPVFRGIVSEVGLSNTLLRRILMSLSTESAFDLARG